MSTTASTTAPATSGQRSRSIARRRPLLDVMGWELRRFRASRLFWIQALCFFGLLLFVTWFGRAPDRFANQTPKFTFSGFVAGTSVWGLAATIPPIYLTLLVLLLPFVTADGVTRDLSRRTHELLMTTELPTWAYVWGRYLVGLMMSLGLALLLLADILGMGLLLHLTVPAYPLPPVGAVLLLWVGMVVPAVVLVSSLSFALGTLLPRQTNVVKIAILVAWIVGAVVIPPSGSGDAPNLPAWYVNWDPTSAATGHEMVVTYQTAFQNQVQAATNATQVQQILIAVENKIPDLAGWFAPHLLLGALSLLLVALAAFGFQRFRNAFN